MIASLLCPLSKNTPLQKPLLLGLIVCIYLFILLFAFFNNPMI
jgi:hypothetical protein